MQLNLLVMEASELCSFALMVAFIEVVCVLPCIFDESFIDLSFRKANGKDREVEGRGSEYPHRWGLDQSSLSAYKQSSASID